MQKQGRQPVQVCRHRAAQCGAVVLHGTREHAAVVERRVVEAHLLGERAQVRFAP